MTDRDKCDRLWSELIRARDVTCQAAEMFPNIKCWGPLEAMHLIPRDRLTTRCELWNGRAGCAAHHIWLTEHPLDHAAFARKVCPGFEVSKAVADRAFTRPDWAEVYKRLQADEEELHRSLEDQWETRHAR